MTARRSFLVPEVVQTSAMDCGPAALASLLRGFGVNASYERLREACQTDVDGTSIDTLEEVACAMGLDAEQTLVPVDHLLLPEAKALPALVVVRLPNGFTHFVVAWRTIGSLVELMDPASGRRWVPASSFLRDLYVHEMPVPAQAFADWAVSAEFLEPMRRRLAAMGCAARVEPTIVRALEQGDWRSLARVDAAARMTTAVVRAGGLARGAEAAAATLAQHEHDRTHASLAAPYWTGRPAADAEDGEPRVVLRGAVALQVHGVRPRPTHDGASALPRELAAALQERPVHPLRELARIALDGGRAWLLAGSLATATIAATIGTALEALVLRAAIDVGRELGVLQQRMGGVVAIAALLVGLLALEVFGGRGTLRIGRVLELRLRALFLGKLPRLGDRYFSTRPVSDMAQRAHVIHGVRAVPELALQIARVVAEATVTAAGIVWLVPASAPLAALAAVLVVGVPFASLPILVERDLRLRTHAGALARFALDATLGLLPIRAHAAERAVQREHESLLTERVRAARSAARAHVAGDFVQTAAGFGVCGWIVARAVVHGAAPGILVLLVYWALQLPVLGQDLVALLRQYPQLRTATLRLLEPLRAPPQGDERAGQMECVAAQDAKQPVAAAAVRFEDVRVVAGGHVILDEVGLDIEPGSHVAIVGASGAGKSSLLGLLLGWHRCASGRVIVDGAPPGEALRSACAWVDPQVTLWNRSAAENLVYGAPPTGRAALGDAIATADLHEVLEKLPEGLGSSLGEAGGLVSGGEGQRLRLARALLRADARLVLLDEPFRGLDRERRHALLGRARAWWKGATLLCATHDIADTLRFDRVLVVHDGRVVEDGPPRELQAREGSRYRALLEEEFAVLREIWAAPGWRRVRVDAGTATEDLPSLSERRATLPRADGGRS